MSIRHMQTQPHLNKTLVTSPTPLFRWVSINYTIMKEQGYKRIDPNAVRENLIKLIASDWMLVSAGDKEKFNTMTANWGGAGYLWNKPVVFVFVRPERYTY